MVLRFLMLLAFFVLSCSNYDRDNAFDSKGKNSQYETCGDWNFNPHPDKGAEQRCNDKNNTIESKCGTSWYNASNSALRCQKNVVETKCGSSWYNASNSILRCQDNVIEKKCGSGNSWYDTTSTSLRCKNDVVETMCGGSWYDRSKENDTWKCQNDVVLKKCGSGNSWYDPTNNTLRCQNNVVLKKCGSGDNWYDTTNTTLRCQKSVIEKKCGSGWYNLSEENDTWKCQGTDLYKICYGNWFNTATYYCSIDGEATKYKSFDYDGKTYKTFKIGDQEWMAENLNYNSPNSKCYGNTDTNCGIYGRLYNWEEARSYCPSGWRLPTIDEWYDIYEDYGFTPLLGGRYTSSFVEKDKFGYWWSATADETSTAYGKQVSSEGENYSFGDISLPKSNLLSVRCIKR